jgi:hypothetical protein
VAIGDDAERIRFIAPSSGAARDDPGFDAELIGAPLVQRCSRGVAIGSGGRDRTGDLRIMIPPL